MWHCPSFYMGDRDGTQSLAFIGHFTNQAISPGPFSAPFFFTLFIFALGLEIYSKYLQQGARELAQQLGALLLSLRTWVWFPALTYRLTIICTFSSGGIS